MGKEGVIGSLVAEWDRGQWQGLARECPSEGRLAGRQEATMGSARRPGSEGGAPDPTVLLVDDDPDLLEMLDRVLRREPYRIELAADGQQALRVLDAQKVKVAVVVADERMPGMTGIELLEHLQTAHPEAVRIMLTGQASLELAQRAINDGQVFRFLTKPIEPRDLIRVIREALAEHDVQAELSPALPRARREAAERRTLETQWRGLTHVERDASGAVVLPEIEDDLESVVREASQPLRPVPRRRPTPE